jgi:PilZ domain
VVIEALEDFRGPERRRHQRADVALSGRYMLADRHEYSCQAINISAGGVAVLGAIKGAIGERVVAYFDRIGRVEGMVVRQFGRCFAIALSASALKREKLDLRIAWLVKRQAGLVSDNRRSERVAVLRWRTTLKTADGKEYAVSVIDLSVSDAAIAVEAAPPIGSDVTLGQRPAKVVRHLRGGIAVAFKEPLGEADLRRRAEL